MTCFEPRCLLITNADRNIKLQRACTTFDEEGYLVFTSPHMKGARYEASGYNYCDDFVDYEGGSAGKGNLTDEQK